MSEENQNQELEAAYAQLKASQKRLKEAKGSKPTKLRYRVKADPVKYVGLTALTVLGGIGLGRNRALTKELENERSQHALTNEELEQAHGAYGELKRRADEAGVDTDTVSLQVVRDNTDSAKSA